MSVGVFPAEEVEALLHSYPQAIVSTPALLSIIFSRLPAVSLRVKLIASQSYPLSPLVVELSNSNLSESILAKLHTAIDTQNQKLTGHPHLLASANLINDIVQSNILLTAHPEIIELRTLITELKRKYQEFDECWLKANEVSGRLRLRVANNAGQFVEIMATVLKNYPYEDIQYKIGSTNYDLNFISLLLNRAISYGTKIAKIAQDDGGIDSGQTNSASCPLINRDQLHDMKKDIKFLKQLADMKPLSESDKSVRRMKTRLVKAETQADSTHEADSASPKNDQATNPEVSNTDTNRDQIKYTLFPTFQYLMENYLFPLPSIQCPFCRSPLIPSPRSKTHSPEFDVVHCGHIYHSKCLLQYMSQPPFDGKICSYADCHRIIIHSKYSDDTRRKLEKDWENKERLKQEMSEVLDFLT
ncbi:hypothetical protein BKA69DRAFT_1041042 [Paraphysoderma sedebokerense]|nr:hypothetical protein BKA69DRAFT_1041042 [Paraphysoderma sedebokerense]